MKTNKKTSWLGMLYKQKKLGLIIILAIFMMSMVMIPEKMKAFAEQEQELGSSNPMAINPDFLAPKGADDVGIYRYEQISYYDDNLDLAMQVCVHDDLAFLLNGRDGLLIVDISSPASPQVIGQYKSQMNQIRGFYDICYANGYVYVKELTRELSLQNS